MSIRLDQNLVNRGLVSTRSQAESYIKLGKVKINGQVVKKPGTKILKNTVVQLTTAKMYVSRGGLKLESVADKLELDFRDMTVLDVGSSTGGFSDYALQHGAARVIAIDIGKQQLAGSLRTNPKVELYEQTDIKDVDSLSTKADIALIDVSFTSIKPILEHLVDLLGPDCIVIGMVKPQFEAGNSLKHKGVIKNQAVRRKVLRDFENWVKDRYKILGKADSQISGEKGNVEKFYKLGVLA